MKELNVGDRVKIIATNQESDKQYIGLIGTVSQLDENKADILVDGKYIKLHGSTIVKKLDAEATPNIILNPNFDGGFYHLEYSLDENGKLSCTVYIQDENGNYEEIDNVDVTTVLHKYLINKGVF